MSHPKQGGKFEKGICMKCKELKDLQDHQGIKLCHECEEEFFEPLAKLHDQQQYGKDIVDNEKKKKDN